MVTQTPASLEKSPWKDNQDNTEYDDQQNETFEGGNGVDDDNEWREEASVEESKATVMANSPTSIKTITSETSSRRSTATPKQSPANHPLPWSPDPHAATDEDAKPAAEATIHSPPKVARVNTQETKQAPRLTGLPGINASRADMIAGINRSLQLDKEREAAQAAKEAQAAKATEHPLPQYYSPERPQTSDINTSNPEWQTIQEGASASKRKAKASPKPHDSSIRKPAPPRSVKKQLFEPATSHTEAPAHKN